MQPVQALSTFIFVCVAVTGPVAWGMWVLLKRRYDRAYENAPEASTEEILRELDREFTPSRRTTVRTQTEYLPFLLECIHKEVDSGFGETQMIWLLRRIEFHRPDEEKRAMFTVAIGKQRSDLHFRWVRDACDRILLRIQGDPDIIDALREHKKRIPRAIAVGC